MYKYFEIIDYSYADTLKKEFMKKFGKKVKMYRIIAKFTQEKLAEKCNCSPQTISGIETGYSFPSSNMLIKLVESLNISLNDLFNFEDVKDSTEKTIPSQFAEIFGKLDEEHQKIMLKIMKELSLNK